MAVVAITSSRREHKQWLHVREEERARERERRDGGRAVVARAMKA
eukprot:COSAG01_NODE_145_length_24103_cov_41.178012_6_plen_45_part_00